MLALATPPPPKAPPSPSPAFEAPRLAQPPPGHRSSIERASQKPTQRERLPEQPAPPTEALIPPTASSAHLRTQPPPPPPSTWKPATAKLSSRGSAAAFSCWSSTSPPALC